MSNQAKNLMSQAGHVLSSADELLARDPMRRLHERQGARVIGKLADTAGLLDIKFEVPANQIWRPAESYFRAKFQITKPNGQPFARASVVNTSAAGVVGAPNVAFEMVSDEEKVDQVYAYALAPNVVAQMIRSIKVRIGDKEISSLDNVGATDTLLRRLTGRQQKSDYSFWSRHAQVSARGPLVPGVGMFATGYYREDEQEGWENGTGKLVRSWTPCSSIFAHPTLPGGTYGFEIDFQPVERIKNAIVQHLLTDNNPNDPEFGVVAGDLTIDLLDFKFMYMTEDRLPDMNWTAQPIIEIPEIRAAAIPIHGFDAQSATHNVATWAQFVGVALADNRQWSLMSKTDGPAILRYTGGQSGDGFPQTEADDLCFAELQVQHAGDQFPQKPLRFSSERYTDDLFEMYSYTKAIANMASIGRYRESYSQFVQAGKFFFTQINKSKGETQVQVDLRLLTSDRDGDALVENNYQPRLILFEFGYKAVELAIAKNSISGVRTRWL